MLDTTFPHDKPQMLYWNVQSEIDGEATVEITYFTSGISWAADYVVHRGQGRNGAWPRRVRAGFEPRARNTKTRRCGWWWGRSTWWRRSRSWRRFRWRTLKELDLNVQHGLKLDAAKRAMELAAPASAAG